MTQTASPPTALIDRTRKLVYDIAVVLVADTSSVEVSATPCSTGTLLLVTVAPDDFGSVIGKQGRTARSLRTVIAATSLKHKHRFELQLTHHAEAVQTAAPQAP